MDDDKEWGTAAAPTPAQLDDKFISAVQAWLSIPPSEVQDLRASMLASPLNFVAKYINSLPSQLLVPFAEVTTAQERSRIPLVMYRRQSWARRADRLSGDGGQDDIDATTTLGLEASRRRLPELWSSIVGSTTRPRLRHFPTPCRRPAARQLDPPFPDHPAAAVPGYKAAAGTTSSVQYGPAHEGDLFSHPRLARLMDEQDEEEDQERQREERDGLHGAEVEEGEDEEDDEQIEEELMQVFQRAVVERFIKGDPTLPSSLYARIDFEDSSPLHQGERRETQASASRGEGEAGGVVELARRQEEILDEERYFDDDDGDDDHDDRHASDANGGVMDY
ncbi:hypothetical protein BDZ90DRAFT_233130 [Jaminaea rosea]|uniref:CCD97-like C-terminal domain-containing protein n=1 Tax=Jaminaea rosea TaxID=1569628 RepID=A0A316UQB9_9BASI|nr:hypothetical protein BDZ90DRAFT_233130 [Jaminaea rosea]PWN26501.1 hypothetical protein BDZ90DRAFT_233130 [Jaminaea rosea]